MYELGKGHEVDRRGELDAEADTAMVAGGNFLAYHSRVAGGAKEKPVVLVVDDDPMLRELHVNQISRFFNRAVEVVAAADMDEAIAQASKYRERISLVVLDIAVAKDSGYEVIAALVKGNIIRCTPTMFVTSQEPDIGQLVELHRQKVLALPMRTSQDESGEVLDPAGIFVKKDSSGFGASFRGAFASALRAATRGHQAARLDPEFEKGHSPGYEHLHLPQNRG